jgi:hypothetical protein
MATAGNGVEGREALEDIRLHLSDRLPVSKLTGLLPRLAECGPEAVAEALVDWASGQRPASPVDDLSRGFRRLLLLGSLPSERRWAFFREVAAALLERLPAHAQEGLSLRVAPLLLADAGPPRPGGASTTNEDKSHTSPRRLTLILDRLDASKEQERGRRPTARLVKEAVLTATLAASSSRDLERSLKDLQQRGVVAGAPDVVRALVQALPPWPLPDLTMRSAPAVAAIERFVSLAPDGDELVRRFHELVVAGAETFNSGALDRAEVVFAVVQRLLDRRVIEEGAVAPLRANGHERLDLDRLGRLLEGEDRREIPRSLLRFYRVFDPTALLDKLHREPTRQRRGMLLALLEAHGAEGREAVFERLSRRPEDLQDVFLVRNLVHLLRRIPEAEPRWSREHELARVVRLLVPENPQFLVREVLAYLADRRHPVAEQVLVQFLGALEQHLLSAPIGGERGERQQWLVYLDEVCAALARQRTPRAWRALVDHGLRREPELGHPVRRLAHLASENLSREPALVSRLVAAARSVLPRGLLARLSAEQDEFLRHVVAALSDTPGTEVQELLETLAERFPDENVGRRAARALAAAAGAGPGRHDAVESAALAGDLRAFGLPTLLQNLADSGVTGVVRLLDGRGQRAATLELEHGRLSGARYGQLQGHEVVYQLLERPVRGTFAFVPRKSDAGHGEAARSEITPLLLEGLRRHDELRRATLLVPDNARLEATDLPPQAVSGEEDLDLVISLWEKVASGATPRECEGALVADAYRIRRCLVSWVEEGALRPQAAAAKG